MYPWGGIGFEAIGGLRIKKEHELMVTFNLDDTHSSVIKKHVVVRNVRDKFVGSEFLMPMSMTKPWDFICVPEILSKLLFSTSLKVKHS